MKRTGSIFISIFCVLCAAAFIVCGRQISAGAVRGIRLCMQTVIPSLFCFMVLTGFLINSGVYRIISMPFSLISKHLLHIPQEYGSIVLLSLVGGYPVGAKAISSLIKQNRMERSIAQRMLLYCCCAGPSFIINAVGIGMFGSADIGIMLYLIQLAVSLLLAIVVGLFWQDNEPISLPTASPVLLDSAFMPFSQSFVLAVSQSVSSLGMMCGFIVLFESLGGLLLPLIQNKTLSCLLMGMLEVTNGCAAASSMAMGPVFASCFLSFCGFSVIAQISGIIRGTDLYIRPFVLFRMLHTVLSGAATFIYLHFFPQIADTLAVSHPVPIADERTPLLTVCLIVMCAIFMRECFRLKKNEPTTI